MSSTPAHSAMDAGLVHDKPKTRGFLHIVRHGLGPFAMYVLTYHHLDRLPSHSASHPHPMVAEGAQPLIELLEELGVDFRRTEVRGALQDVLRFGSANIPDLWFGDEDLSLKNKSPATEGM
jgi:hypothetical protein